MFSKKQLFPLLILLYVFSADCRRSPQEILATAAENPTIIDKLDLGLGQMGQVPPVLFTFPNLKWLDLRMNELTSLPENTGDWSNLEYLNIYGNDIDKLPASFQKLPKLKFFFAGNNDFESIPLQLTGTQVEAVYLDSNKISWNEADVETVLQIKNLEVLDLARNRKIVSMPKNLSSLANHPKLRMIILKETGLKPSQVEAARQVLPQVKLEF
ncbi:leucine-rich repeat domain-containing protein [Leptospira langatensis]|uniref:Leucine-rich repeat domain-containing protein n=1 Tax=Leptospira langatensis TaxID=2484983 RepID=A0A5F1ZTK3_9LEPT|nr:leucine-rich repeat domain-containing protein [Leptospira langatensis]TGJ98897.1 leucine-rich repeat domain-containing protein [Leptospira langatensis]TGL40536.1 leucine-rich repeat domain-containing protein [Leptospira langatensis]